MKDERESEWVYLTKRAVVRMSSEAVVPGGGGVQRFGRQRHGLTGVEVAEHGVQFVYRGEHDGVRVQVDHRIQLR